MDEAPAAIMASNASPAVREKVEATTLPNNWSSTDVDNKKASAWKKGQSKRVELSQKHIRDEKVMETNNSSIVSKRSVERLYHPKPHFFQFFVRKPLRRSPLINRGYRLRMYAINEIIHNFLHERAEKHKIVLNLGCGYDPLPFHWLSQSTKDGITFVDIDYPELMSKKRRVIIQHEEMLRLINPVQTDTGDPAILMSSDRYMAIGCDLRNITELGSIVERRFDLDSCTVLCIAEVSMTYMDVDAADRLVKWTAQFSDVKFCLLEQCLPYGDKHPFAQKMLQHFEKLGSPLKSIRKYPTLGDQHGRFLTAGYRSVQALTLWDLWQDPSSLPLQEGVNKVEQFDEWEEFALFSSHYFLLEAVKSSCVSTCDNGMRYIVKPQPFKSQPDNTPRVERLTFPLTSSPNNGQERRFGAITSINQDTFGFHGGIGNKGRMANTDRYRLSSCEAQCERFPDPPFDTPARACHTVTRLPNGKDLLTGGRTSPDEALNGCWLRSSNGWKAVGDLPIPLYRHCATAVRVDIGDDHAGVLVFGGRTTNGVAVSRWFLWRETKGWEELYGHSLPKNYEAVGFTPRFGATLATSHDRSGLLFGGMTELGVFYKYVWEWSIEVCGTDNLRILLRHREDIHITPRLGACIVGSPTGFLLIGGIFESSIPSGEDVLFITNNKRQEINSPREWMTNSVNLDFGSSRPLFVGHAAHWVGNQVLIIGGGAVCFSFGAHWNREIWTIHCQNDGKDVFTGQRWIVDNNAPLNDQFERRQQVKDAREPTTHMTEPEKILRTRMETAEDFDQLVAKGKPFVMEGLDIGCCTQCWTAEKLIERVDPKRMVTVHQAQENDMNFQRKNYSYVKKHFGDFVTEALQGSRQYLRSLAAEKPADKPACFRDDFPQLQGDFQLPEQLEMVSRNHHSSPLRISGPVNMWLHYDVMANVLCQISGAKILALYPPSDAIHFQIPPGSSSSPMNVWADDANGRGVMAHEHPYIRATLNRGDVLYIPPLWLHTASPLENLSIAINVFFKSFKGGYSAGRDVYGNRDLQAYENGRKSIEKMLKAFDNVSRDVRSVYLERLAEELKEKANIS